MADQDLHPISHLESAMVLKLHQLSVNDMTTTQQRIRSGLFLTALARGYGTVGAMHKRWAPGSAHPEPRVRQY